MTPICIQIVLMESRSFLGDGGAHDIRNGVRATEDVDHVDRAFERREVSVDPLAEDLRDLQGSG